MDRDFLSAPGGRERQAAKAYLGAVRQLRAQRLPDELRRVADRQEQRGWLAAPLAFLAGLQAQLAGSKGRLGESVLAPLPARPVLLMQVRPELLEQVQAVSA